MQLEVCVNSFQSAIAAELGGADRVELCDNIIEGGTTPSFGLVSAVRKNLSIDVHILIRPRGGDFLYNQNEIEIMKTDISTYKALGVDGFVFGCLTPDGNVDKSLCYQLIEICYPKKTTFHRAFDMANNAIIALEDINKIGFDYLLTSGQEKDAFLGVELISYLIKTNRGNCRIMPGSGINEDNIAYIAQKTGADIFHVSLRKSIDSEMKYRKKGIIMGKLSDKEEYEFKITDENRVRKVVEILKQIK